MYVQTFQHLVQSAPLLFWQAILWYSCRNIIGQRTKTPLHYSNCNQILCLMSCNHLSSFSLAYTNCKFSSPIVSVSPIPIVNFLHRLFHPNTIANTLSSENANTCRYIMHTVL